MSATRSEPQAGHFAGLRGYSYRIWIPFFTLGDYIDWSLLETLFSEADLPKHDEKPDSLIDIWIASAVSISRVERNEK